MLNSKLIAALFAVIVSIVFSLVAPSAAADVQQVIHYYCIDVNGEISLCQNDSRPEKFDSHLVAFAKYSNRINETGWAEFELVTNGELDDSTQAYYGGFLEGYVTSWLIDSHRHNMFGGQEEQFCKQYSQFIEQNINWTIQQIQENPLDPYWQQIAALLYQLNGINDGNIHERGKVPKFNKPHLEVEPCGVIMMNLFTEVGDIDQIIKQEHLVPPETHCSVLIKVLEGNSDILVGHDTWATPILMLRIAKRVTLNLKSSNASTIIMSSYPGMVSSVDDFYITSQQLAVTETSNENWNDKLWDGYGPENIVLEFLRVMVANRLARTGEQWARLFSEYNSGTYNNQFMVIDYKLFTAGQPLQPGLLTILEQLPAIIEWADVTRVLSNQSYWASYNIAFFKAMYRESWYDKQAKQFGEYYSYENTPRAKIFRRDHKNVTNLASMYHMMRYNDFRHDPLSRCDNCKPNYSAVFTIAARGDLNNPNGTYPNKHWGFRPVMAYDTKIANFELVKSLEMVAVSGPSSQNVEPFSWKTTKLNLPHRDQPIEWTFNPVRVSWNNQNAVFPNVDFEL